MGALGVLAFLLEDRLPPLAALGVLDLLEVLLFLALGVLLLRLAFLDPFFPLLCLGALGVLALLEVLLFLALGVLERRFA